ncbi:MAG: DNA-protecting protein DprA [Candidatus Cloacimonetes bacterium]|nr:DNA-protecting protein DprA [Candidatus Cloacimonadota bacterium]
MDEERKYYIALSCVEGLGPVQFSRLLKFFGTAKNIWQANLTDLQRLHLGPMLLEHFLQKKENFDFEAMIERLDNLRVKVLTLNDNDYPSRLKQIYDPPFVLYVRGEIKKEDELAIAIVGSRKITTYGREVAKNLVESLVAQGLTIVSGMAFGVDVVSQKAVLDAGGRVIAVLASGVDKFTPATNSFLAERILEERRGAIISEYPLGTLPQRYFFPVRNRIISGLALGTVVIEAGEQSGTVHTARAALEQGRDVFAVPGSIFSPLSVGTHNLIKQGAILVNSAEDIIEELNLPAKGLELKAREVVPETENERTILGVLGNDELHIDKIIQQSKLPTATVAATLTMMEMKGKIKNTGNQVYRIVR